MIVRSMRARADRCGMAMMYACFGVIAAATTVSIAMNMSLSSDRRATTQVRSTRARYLAEAALEQAKADVAAAIANWEEVPAFGVVNVPGLVDAGVNVPYTVQATGFSDVAADAAGIQTIVTGYELRATATFDGFSYTAHRLVNTEATPIFQFAVFYDADLEINPGPAMTLGGRVHANGDMYLNCGATLRMNTNYVRAVGNIYRNRKDDPSQSVGNVDIRQWVVNPFDTSEPSSYVRLNSQSQMTASLGFDPGTGYDSEFTQRFDSNGDGDYDDVGDWYDFVTGAWNMWAPPGGYGGGDGHTVMTGEHGQTMLSVPDIGSIKMYEPVDGGSFGFNSATNKYEFVGAGNGTHDRGFYHANADLSVITYADGSVKAFDGGGQDVTSDIASALSTTTMYDTRQAGGAAGNVAITEINLGQLAALNRWPSNGLIYAAHYNASTGTAAKGVRLVNGASLPSKLTVVSENSVYVKGNFNTVQKKGAAVIADAVNLLSNAWNDSKTSTSSLPVATATTYNLGMITGNTTTQVGGQYNGGLENLPRFHEKWAGVNCTITGSFVNAWRSNYATGNWVIGGKYYQAPNRVWNYDTRFNNVNNLPPFTPMVVTAVDVCTW